MFAELVLEATGFARATRVSFKKRTVPSLLILRVIKFQPELTLPSFVFATFEPPPSAVPCVLAKRPGVTRIVSENTLAIGALFANERAVSNVTVVPAGMLAVTAADKTTFAPLTAATVLFPLKKSLLKMQNQVHRRNHPLEYGSKYQL